jgi:hypothetical protein
MSRKPESLFDKRIIARNLHHKRLSRKEYEQYLAGLEDVARKAVPIFFEAEERREPDPEERQEG